MAHGFCLVFFLMFLGAEGVKIRHQRRPKESTPLLEAPTPSLPHEESGRKCNASLPSKCTCSKDNGSPSITCFRAGLRTIPELELGPRVIQTLNFEQNNLTRIDIGAFFGLKIERLLLSNNSIHTLNFLAFWGLEYHLETLDLSYNHFGNVPSDALRLLRNLQSLSLTGNRITSLRDFDFGYLRRLDVLALDKNPITVIAPHTFAGTQLSLLALDSIRLDNGLDSFPTGELKLLRGLSLADNRLSSFPTGWFESLKSLSYLCLDRNKFSDFGSLDFVGVEETLKTLELNENRFRRIPKGLLRNLPKLETLEMRDNRIRKVFPRTFNVSYKLESLDLSHNQISKLSNRAFWGLENMRRIDLRSNQLITLDDRMFYWEKPAGREVYLDKNPWLCNCLLQWLKRAFKRETELSKIFVDRMALICARPYSLEGVPLVRVHLKEFTCDHDYYYYYEVTSEKETEREGEDDVDKEEAIVDDVMDRDDDVTEYDDDFAEVEDTVEPAEEEYDDYYDNTYEYDTEDEDDTRNSDV